MKKGKLPSEILGKYVLDMIAADGVKRGEVVSRAGLGVDCAVLDVGDEYLSVSCDPITTAGKNIGRLAVHVNVNDMAASGCEPVGMTMTLLLPPDAPETELETIIKDAVTAANEVGVEIVGGHTEITDAVNRPVLSAAVFGKSVKRRFVASSGAKAGQQLVLTKWAGLEGTVILAYDAEETFDARFGADFTSRAKKCGDMLSVMRESRVAMAFGAAAMHDATEGGVLGACYEIAHASKIGVDVFAESIPILPETRAVCDFLNINPLKLISSGAMLIAADDGAGLVEKLNSEGINAVVIGRFTPPENGRRVFYGETAAILEQPEADEIYQAHKTLALMRR
jgi:hydrogenase maturation factor